MELQEKYWASGLRVIGISLDDEAEPIRKFYREIDMNYPVAMGGDPLSQHRIVAALRDRVTSWPPWDRLGVPATAGRHGPNSSV